MTTEWIDTLREVFGKEEIDRQIRRGMAGQPTFWAEENGIEVGTKPDWVKPAGPPGAL